jgi:hypothetical protein
VDKAHAGQHASHSQFETIRAGMAILKGQKRCFARAPTWVTIGAVPLLIYMGLCLGCFGVPGSWTRDYFGGGDSDAFAFVWFLNWWPYAVIHHLNPFITDFAWFPAGYNLSWTSSAPFAALLAAPITLTAGPVLSFNVITMTSPVLSAWSAFLLARYLTKDWQAALLGGYFFGFSSYEIGHMMGHLNLEMIWLIPIILLLCAARTETALTRCEFTILTALALLCQLGLSLEILASACLFLSITWLVLMACSNSTGRWRLAMTGLEFLAAFGLMVAAGAPLFYYLIKGISDVPAQLNDPSVFSTDPLNFIVPTAISRLGSTEFSGVSATFTGALPGQGAYLGIPLIAIMVLGMVSARRSRAGRALMLMTVLAAVFSLGPWLHWGATRTDVALPWALLSRLPVMGNMLPNRFSMYVALGAALASAGWLAAASGRSRLIRFAIAVGAVFTLWPNAVIFPWTMVPEVAFFDPGNIRNVLGAGKNVLILPFGADGAGALWQVQSGMAFTQTGGYLGYIPRHEAASKVVDDLINGEAEVDFAGAIPGFCARHRVDDILVGPGAEPALLAAVEAQHWPQSLDDGFTIVHVPVNLAWATGRR